MNPSPAGPLHALRRGGGALAAALGALGGAALAGAPPARAAAPAPAAPAPAASIFYLPGMPVPTGIGGAAALTGSPGDPGSGTGMPVTTSPDTSVGNLGIVVGGPGSGGGGGAVFYAPSDSGVATGRDLYVVQPGDTLWDLCGYFFGNPYLWPKIWAYNPVITNPHWIYPGDVLRLAPEVAAAAVPVPLAPAAAGPVIEHRKLGAPDTVYLHKTAYVTAQEFEHHGEITGASEDKFLLTVYDTIYVQYPKEKDLPKVGDELTIYERSDKKEDAERSKKARKLGSLVSIKGKARVTRVEKETGIATADITEAFGTIERGHHAGPFKATLAIVPPAPNKVELTGSVVEGIRGEELVGRYTVVIVDLGRDNGVELGNRLWVLRRGDGLPGPVEAAGYEAKDAKRTDLPIERIAELRVIDVKEKTSTCVVTTALRDVQIGDKLLMRKGY